MIDPDCKVCLSIGWVCENHPQRAWTDELGCQCGAGMPCECVRTDGLDAGHREELRSHSPILDANWLIHLLQKNGGRIVTRVGERSECQIGPTIRDERTWYNRYNQANRYMNCVLINYPAVEDREWDAVVTRISLSLGK